MSPPNALPYWSADAEADTPCLSRLREPDASAMALFSALMFASSMLLVSLTDDTVHGRAEKTQADAVFATAPSAMQAAPAAFVAESSTAVRPSEP